MVHATDDDSGWTDVLLEHWGEDVRDEVVADIERQAVGLRGVLVRGLRDDASDPGHHAAVEQVHAAVVAGIAHATGADLDHLGSQAAWACYEEVWDELARRWGDGGDLAPVSPAREVRVLQLLHGLTTRGAQWAGADVGSHPVEPLRIGGIVRIDVEGLFAYLATDDAITDVEAAVVRRLVDEVRGRTD